MKIAAVMTAVMLLAGGSAMAQTSNSTVEGTKTAPSNGAGMPGANAPTGHVTTTAPDTAATSATTGAAAASPK